ncbi:LamG-like jellyroll fold domain-containing protein [Flavobacterium branchiophilum]|uniref:PKD domain-containing protein n=1 Tax=Flavobacterium branchiophilum TaxID=55197 RepID=A0A2H3KA63_9FLAO|nr:LamG-like jellyroll fold domain-containing protein [Flavobacterium branchiophilum]PDS23372.1 hypothetical protein B0A77_11010 [Flavobacterium branchiophilum]
MKKILLLFGFLFCFLLGFGQNKDYYPKPKYPALFKTLGCPVKASDPEWVKKMYSENPNFFEVSALYDAYYKTHVLEKNTHTQNYKQFFRLVNTNKYYNSEGEIVIEEPLKTAENTAVASKNNNQYTVSDAWVPVAPIETFETNGNRKSSQVNIYCFTQSTSNPNVLYCGTETGAVFKSIDKSENWTEVGKTVFDYGTSQAIKVDPNNENIVYVAHDTRLFKSIDGGQNWTLMLTSTWQNDVEVSPNNSNIVFVSGSFGLKRSTDAGQTWTNITADVVTDIEFKSNDASVVYIAKKNSAVNRFEIWKSTDAGLTFMAKTSGWFVPTNGVANHAEGAKIANTLADPNRLYVLLLGSDIDYATDINYIGVYKSTDAGESWSLPYDGNNDGTPDNNPGGPYSATHWAMSTFNVNGGNYDQGFYNAAIDASDTDPNVFMVGMLNLFRSSDGGTTFKLHGGYGCNNCSNRYRHPDIQGIQVQGNDAWVVTDGGVDQYDGNLNFLDSKNKGITTCDLWGFDQGWNEDVVVGGRYHTGNMAYHENYQNGKTISLGGGESATGFVNLGDNKKTYFDDIGGKWIPATSTGNVQNIPSITLYPKSGNSLEKSEIVNDPRWWNNIYLGKDNKIWASEDYGASFNLLHEFGVAGNTVRGIEVSRHNPNLIFAVHHLGSTVKLWKSTDAGVNWTEITLPLIYNKFSMSLNEQDELFIAYDVTGNSTTKVYKSVNLGQSWSNITTTALNGFQIRDIEVQEGTNGGVYIICSRHVFYKNNTLTNWVDMSNGIPSSFRLLDAKPFYKSGKLRIAGNRGVWEHDFYENSVPKAQPMVANKQVYCNRQIVQFEDYSILNHTNATWQWSFPGATSISSTSIRNPLVVYANPGTYNVSLTVTNPQGTSSKTIQNMIVVNPSECTPKPFAEKAALFNGTNSQYLTKNFNPQKTVTNFTFSAWIKPNGIQQDYSSILYTNGITLDFKNGTNELGTHCGGLWWYNSGLIVPKDKWSYVALIYTPTKVTLVLNEKTYEINTSFPSQNLSTLDLGIHNRRNDRQYKGILEEVCLWDRALTLDEIRLNKHLTKVGNSDNNLFAYYQFNSILNNEIFDVKNNNDLSVINGTSTIDSSCPIGPGVAQALTINQNNSLYHFTTPNVIINTGTTNPNGRVVVTRITTEPYLKPNADYDINNEYYCIENYGTVSDVNNLSNVVFTDVSNLSGLQTTEVKLFERERNSDVLSDWTDKGNPTTINASAVAFAPIQITSPIPFNNNATANTLNQSSGQFYFKSRRVLNNTTNTLNQNVLVYPNPSSIESGFYFKNIGQQALLNVYDSTGKLIFISKINESEKINAAKAPGIYFYSVESLDKIITGKIIIK